MVLGPQPPTFLLTIRTTTGVCAAVGGMIHLRTPDDRLADKG